SEPEYRCNGRAQGLPCLAPGVGRCRAVRARCAYCTAAGHGAIACRSVLPEALVEERVHVVREVGGVAMDLWAMHHVGHVVDYWHPGRLRHHPAVERAVPGVAGG